MTPEQWRTLVLEVQHGDRAALDKLATQLQPQIARYCQPHDRLLRRAGTSAEDLTQDVWVGVLDALPRYHPVPGRPFLAWVHAIATRRIADAFRQSARRQALVSLDDLPGEPTALSTGDPSRILEHREQVSVVATAVRALAPRRRDALLQHLLGERDSRIAARWGASVSAVRVARHKAMTLLRTSVTDWAGVG
ncbi:RNA polymerase sigma factor [Amycolatopsis thermoflava]|uniref:RNA polymerase sigma factor n=1 Tax=Amycolatopsis thermoflava TaxID=84480 RepID=UPI003D7043BC